MSTAALVHEENERVKDSEFSPKIKFLRCQRMYTMEAAHWPDLFIAMDSSLLLLACMRTAGPDLSLLGSGNHSSTSTPNGEVYIAAGEPIDQGGQMWWVWRSFELHYSLRYLALELLFLRCCEVCS